ncbi:MAG: M56 family metallopeptidase [Paraprevotella sp.]|nr:M56 family metallopeptidase [Paraprevotella sp.]
MIDLFIYLTKSSICLLVFWMLYRILLSRTTFFRLQRLVLTGGTIASLLLPLVHLETKHESPLQRPMVVLSETLTESPILHAYAQSDIKVEMTEKNDVETTAHVAGTPDSKQLPFHLWLLPIIYLCGCIVILIRRAVGYRRLVHLILNADKVREQEVTWCLTDENVCPCSWGRYILMPKGKYQNDPLIAQHERCHVEHHHHADILFMQALTTVFWFHPIAWLLMHNLKQCHEFQVDRDVCHRSKDAQQYQMLLVREAVGAELFTIASSFSEPGLKQRIDMMRRTETRPWRMCLTLLFIPVGTGLVFAFSEPENREKISHFVKQELLPVQQKIISVPEAETEFPAPAVVDTETSLPQPAEEAPQATEEIPQIETPANKAMRTPINMRYLTSNEYSQAKEQMPFITVYIDAPNQLRLQDIDGTFLPTAFYSLSGDVAVLLRKHFSNRLLSHTVPYAPGVRIVAPEDVPHKPVGKVDALLYQSFTYSAKEMEICHPDDNIGSLYAPSVYWDVPGLEGLTLTRETYKHRYKDFGITLWDENKTERINLNDFTGEELEEAINQYLQSAPNTKLIIRSQRTCWKEPERSYQLYLLMMDKILKHYQITEWFRSNELNISSHRSITYDL